MNQNMDHNVNNVIKTREDEGLKQKDNSKFMKMFKKICIILTIIVVVIAGIRVISSIFLSSEFNPNEILGPLLSAFAFIGAFIYLIGAFVIIAFIWIVYGICIELGFWLGYIMPSEVLEMVFMMGGVIIPLPFMVLRHRALEKEYKLN